MLRSVPSDPVRGNWEAYLEDVASFTATCENMPWLERVRAIADFKRQRIRMYLGPRHRSVTREPKTFSPSFLTQLAARNKQERRMREPYFARIADLYQEVAKLDMEIEQREQVKEAQA